MPRSNRISRYAFRAAIGLAALIALAAAFAIYEVARSFPQASGNIRLPALEGRADVLRDAQGIPQIYAGSMRDLFMAQGFVHAQERFWQMDFWRHIGAGRLSELFGASEVETDAFLRTMAWGQIAQQESAGAITGFHR